MYPCSLIEEKASKWLALNRRSQTSDLWIDFVQQIRFDQILQLKNVVRLFSANLILGFPKQPLKEGKHCQKDPRIS